jgi:uncharacterized protein (TIGR02996 family)
MREALLAAVLAAPGDDAPRLVFADWLLHQDDPLDRGHGELIQVQCALAGLDESGPTRARLVRRACALIAEHGRALVEQVHPLVNYRERLATPTNFQRGFLTTGHVDYFEDISMNLDALLARTPLEVLEVDLMGTTPTEAMWPPLEAAPLDRLRSLVLRIEEDAYYPNPGLRDAALRAVMLVQNRRFDRLALGVEYGSGFRVDPSVLARLANAPVAAELRELRMEGSHLRDGWVWAFIGQRPLGKLETLHISSSLADVGPRQLIELAGSPNLPALRRLLVDATRMSADECATLFAARPGLTGLTLDTGVTPRFLAIPGLERLEELRMMARSVGAGMWGPLIDALPRLRRFALSYNEPGLDGVRAIAGGPPLRRLVLISCSLDDKAAELLLAAPQLDELEHLDLEGNYRIGEGMRGKLRDRFGAAVTFGP